MGVIQTLYLHSYHWFLTVSVISISSAWGSSTYRSIYLDLNHQVARTSVSRAALNTCLYSNQPVCNGCKSSQE